MDGWFEFEDLRDDTARVTEGRGQLPCHMYLLQSEGEALLIDTGLGIGDLRSVVESIAGVTPRVLLTHAHWDHLGNAHQFPAVSVHTRERHQDASVSLSVFEERFDHRPKIFIEEWLDGGRSVPRGFDPDTYRIRAVHDTKPIEEGDTIAVGDRTLEIYEIPGHSPGQIAAVDRSVGICFGGDILEPGGEVFAHFAGSDLQAYQDSLETLIDLSDSGAFDVLVTGHGDPIEDLSILATARDAISTVRAGEVDYDLTQTHWGDTRVYELSGIRVLTTTAAPQ